MKNYAMICNNKVIEVLTDQEVEPKWPPTNDGHKVIAVECDETVERGMIYDPETGEFSEYVPEIVIPEPTQQDRIEESQLIIMEAMADQYEENEERYLNNLEIQATIYESILELGGNV